MGGLRDAPNYEKVFIAPKTPPSNLDWNLWQGPVAEAPYRDLLAPIKWRSWWNYGGNGLGDWGCHILDVMMFAYDELKDPYSVKTDCPEPAGEHFHVNPCKSTIMYKVHSDMFANKTFPVHYADTGLLAVKATRFPGETLLWDKQKLAFTNNQKATDTIVRREYRDGFAPPRVG